MEWHFESQDSGWVQTGMPDMKPSWVRIRDVSVVGYDNSLYPKGKLHTWVGLTNGEIYHVHSYDTDEDAAQGAEELVKMITG